MIIDDDSNQLSMLHTILKNAGYEVTSAVDVIVGIKIVSEIMPDIITLDLIMPKMGGLEALRHLKEDAKTKLIPIIVITSSEKKEDEEKAHALGAKDFIKKPYEKNLLLSAVQKHLIP